MRLLPRLLLAAPLLALVACGSAKPCDGVTGTCVEFSSGATEARRSIYAQRSTFFHQKSKRHAGRA